MSTKVRLLTLILSVLLLVSVTTAYAIDEEALCTGANMNWSNMLYACSIIEIGQNGSGVDWRYEVQYPTRIMFEPFMKDAIDTLLQNQITTFLSDVSNFPDPAFPLWLLIDYDIFHFDDNVSSVVFHIEINLGGAHPNYFVETLTFDRESDQVLDLQDLFLMGSDPFALLVPYVRSELTADLGSDPAIVAGIEAGTQPDYANFRAFAVTDDALIIYFPPYQVAPFAAGGQSVRVPISHLTSIWIIGDDANPVLKG